MITAPRALTIAGSDSGGGAGIQADLKTFSAFGAFGMTAVTALTAQNTLGVTAIHDVPLDFLAAQIDAVATDIGVDAAKTGMLSSAAIVELVASKAGEHGLRSLVVDPVMVAKSGHRLLASDAEAAVRDKLVPLALVVTPNLPEAEALTGLSITGPDAMREAAVRLHAKGARFIVVKGGHLEGSPESVDLVYDGRDFIELRAPRLATKNTHGTGCTFSAAITAGLARGLPPIEAIRRAKRYVTRAIEASLQLGRGHGPTNHLVGVTSEWTRESESENERRPTVVAVPSPVDAPPVIPEKPAVVEPPAPVVAAPAAVLEPPALVVEKPADVEPPPLVVEKPPIVAPPKEADTTSATAPPEPSPEAPSAPPAPPAMVGAPGPIVTAARPGKVSVKGGTRITLYGANFADGCRVLIDGDAATSPTLTDDYALLVVAPPHEAGKVDVVIENPDGQRASLQITYDEGPTIDSLSPLEGSPRGGTVIVVQGRNFQEGCRITLFGSRGLDAVFHNHERIEFTTPPHEEEEEFSGEVRVTNLDGLFAVAPEPFTYRLATPQINTASPASGLVAGGKRVVVTGVDFHPQCRARLGGSPAGVTWKGAGSLVVVTPRAKATGPADLEIENPDGQVAKLEAAFTYEPDPTPPLLVEVRPARGLCDGGAVIRLIGDNFEEDTAVLIGEVRAIARLVSRNEMEVELPARASPGLVAVELRDRHGVIVRRDDGFTYEARTTPRVDSITPRFGSTAGGTRIVIEGAHFDDHVYIRIGGQSPKSAVVRSSSLIEVITPPSRAAGLFDVEVGRGGSGSFVAKSGFRYDALPAPSIQSVAPPKGSTEGGTEVSIEGKNFVAESIVLFGRTQAPKIKFVSGSTLEVKAPPGKNGEMVDVTVRNPDGKEATSKRAFMYDARYRG